MTSQASPVRGGSVQFQRIQPGTLTNPSNTPATTKREPIITINGKQFRVTQIQMKINGAWQDVDLAQFNLSKLAKRCQRIFEETDLSIPDDLSKLTFYFEKNDTSESLISRTLGKVSVLFKAEEKVGLELTKLEVQPKDSDQSQIIKLDEVLEVDQIDIVRGHVIKIDKHTSQGLNNPRFITNSKKIKRNPDPKKSEKLKAVEDTLNVKDAGADENRCAALSVARILLHRNGDNIEQAANAFFQIPIVPRDGEDNRITLAKGLIELAAQRIETDPEFVTNESYYASICAALIAASRNPSIIADESKLKPIQAALAIAGDLNNRQTVVQLYANLIRQPWQMLDVPFFDALKQLGLPVITLKRSRDDYIFGNISNMRFNQSIEEFDLNAVCFVVHAGLHYQPIIMDENPNPAQATKLLSILTNDLNTRLRQLERDVKAQSKSKLPNDQKQNFIAPKIRDLLNIYPYYAKRCIFDLLRGNRNFDEVRLNAASNADFVAEATRAFLSAPVRAITH